MLSAEPGLQRSYLYAPGSRPDVMIKAMAAGADAVIFDLEDAVAPDERPAAREAVASVIRGAVSVPCPIHVRINRSGTGYSKPDLAAVVLPGLSAIRLPKAEDPEAVAEAASALDDLEAERGIPRGQVRLYPIIESARGAAAVEGIAASTARIARLALGASDLLADLGIHEESPLSTLAIRSELVLRSRLAGIGAPIDSVYTDLNDADGLLASASFAASLGFFGKSVIHPKQLAAVHAVFTPSASAVAFAEQVVAAAERAQDAGVGALTVKGQFVDAAILARARAILDMGSRP